MPRKSETIYTISFPIYLILEGDCKYTEVKDIGDTMKAFILERKIGGVKEVRIGKSEVTKLVKY